MDGSNTQRNSENGENGTAFDCDRFDYRQLMDYFYFEIEYTIPAYYPLPCVFVRIIGLHNDYYHFDSGRTLQACID